MNGKSPNHLKPCESWIYVEAEPILVAMQGLYSEKACNYLNEFIILAHICLCVICQLCKHEQIIALEPILVLKVTWGKMSP